MADEKDLEKRLKALEDKNAKLMAALEEKWESAQPQSGITADVLEQILSRSSAAAAQAIAGPMEAVIRKEKPEGPHLVMGPFEHPLGGIKMPKPELKREIVFGRPLPTTELTYVEVVALNQLSDSLGRSQRRIARDGKWKAIVSDDNQRITISIPVKTIDDRGDLPSFLAIVQELTSGERPPEQAELLNEIALMKAQLAELQAQRAAN